MSVFKIIVISLFVIMVISNCTTAPLPFYIFHVERAILTFLRPENPSQYIGYRIVEYLPELTAEPVEGYEEQPNRGKNYQPPAVSDKVFPASVIPSGEYTEQWKTSYQDTLVSFRFDENGTAYFRYLDKRENLYRISVFRAVEDGIDAWMWLETDHEIPGSFIIQQCLRYSGVDNSEWRHQFAMIPELSEYDLWNRGEMRNLSYVRQNDAWKADRPVHEFAEQNIFDKARNFISNDASENNRSCMSFFYTPAGVSIAEKEGIVVKKEAIIPHGLVIRESLDSKIISGMYWERTAKISNHHPADCLHSYVDLGPASPDKRNVVKGKIYYFNGTKDDLLKHWKRDFSE